MIEFTSITVKNLGSYGDHPTTIDLQSDILTLVQGKNGAGKSTILLDALFFALFNRPYREIKKSLLINSINKGGCFVELLFRTRGANYVIRRGMKPNIFEVEKDGVLLDTNVLSKDLQEYLEEDLLALNRKTFGQTAVIGRASFVPFMKLDAAKRREVVDDVLNVGVYTLMAKMAKADLEITNKQLDEIDTELRVVKAQAEATQKVISALTTNQSSIIADFEEQLLSSKTKLAELTVTKDLLLSECDQLTKELPVEPDVVGITNQISALRRKIDSASSKISDLSLLHSCPTCLQKVTDEHKTGISTKANIAIDTMKVQLDELLETETKIRAEETVYLTAVTAIDNLKDRIRLLTYDISSVESEISTTESRIARLKLSDDTKINDEKVALRQLATKAKELLDQQATLRETKALQTLATQLLKDSGIKATVIKEYLPVLNGRINDHLSSYGFDINMTLDENFDETVTSRGRHDFVYNSFSEGEKARIDWSIVMALRDMAMAINSSHVNILILDEILDGSLEPEARVATLELLIKDQVKSNVFVISHTESNSGYYDNILVARKKGDFSYIESAN